jgi:hypothetical protein
VAVVLAGRPNDGLLRSVSAEAWEALIPVAGRPMAAWVVRTLASVPGVGPVVVVGPEALARHVPEAEVVAPGRDMLENLEIGLGRLAGRDLVLVATGDAPLLTRAEVEAFLAGVAARPVGDLYWSIVPREAVEAALPGVRRTWVRLREGTYTGGNLAALRPAAAGGVRALAERLVALRKSPWRLAGLLGGSFLLRFLLGRVRLEEAEARFSRLLGLEGRAVVVPSVGVGVDVDKPSDYWYCERVLRGGVADA